MSWKAYAVPLFVAALSIVAVIVVFWKDRPRSSGPSRWGLDMSECQAWCGQSGVERWERAHESSAGKYAKTFERYCECVGKAYDRR